MKKEPVKVGCKFGTEHFQVVCAVSIPEKLGEMAELAKGSEEFILSMFCRGWRIWNQEQSGARDFIQQSTPAQRKAEDFPKKVQAIIDNADPLAPPSRAGRPAAPKELQATPEIVAAMKKGDMAKFAELAAAQGLRITISK